MKKKIVLVTFLLSLSSAFSAFADESTRPTNPGVDPSEAMTSQGADVALTGICKECLARLKHGRLKDYTNPGARQDQQLDNKTKGTDAVE